MRSMKNVPEYLHKAQVFEFYFYPEYSIKTDKLRVDDPDKIQFLGLRDTLEKCSNLDGEGGYEMKSQVDSFIDYMDDGLDEVKIDGEIEDDHIAGPYHSSGMRRGTLPFKKQEEEMKEPDK